MGRKSYDDGSIMDFAVKGFKNISHLAKSSTISDKLLGFNTLMFVIVISFQIAYFLGARNLSMSFLIMYLLSLVLAFGLSLVYSPLLSLLANFSTNKIESLRLGLIVLFIDLPLSISGIVFKIDLIIQIALVVIGIQLGVIIFSSFLSFSKVKAEDKIVAPTDIWLVVDRTSAILGILSFIVTIVLIIVGK